MRAGLISLVAMVGCVATVDAAPRSADDKVRPGGDALNALNETPITGPSVPLDQLVDQIPDAGVVIELYKAVRTVQDVEAANEYVKAQVSRAQSIAADIARLHAAAFKSCEGWEAPKIDAVATKARSLATVLVRVDTEFARTLAVTRQEVEAERPRSIRAKEEVNRLILAAHELGRLRVQAQEITKSVEGLGVSLRSAVVACTPTTVPPLFAERDAHSTGGIPERRSPVLSPKRVTKPTATAAPRGTW